MKFDHAIADPDWWYNKRLNEQHGGNRTKFGDGVWFKYATPPSDLESICRMPIPKAMAEDSFLHLWTTGPHQFDARDVMEAWGFSFVTVEFIWIKIAKKAIRYCLNHLEETLARLEGQDTIYDILIKGARKLPGNYTASNGEFVLLGKRGAPRRSEVVKMFPQLIFTPLMEHSRKPDRVHKYIDAAWPEARCIEFYARREWPGWVCLGNEMPGQEGLDMHLSIPLVVDDRPPTRCRG